MHMIPLGRSGFTFYLKELVGFFELKMQTHKKKSLKKYLATSNASQTFSFSLFDVIFRMLEEDKEWTEH